MEKGRGESFVCVCRGGGEVLTLPRCDRPVQYSSKLTSRKFTFKNFFYCTFLSHIDIAGVPTPALQGKALSQAAGRTCRRCPIRVLLSIM